MSIIEISFRLLGRAARWSKAKSFAQGKDGVVSVEMAVSAIVFSTLITGMISFGSLFFIQGNMGDAARDAARRVAIGDMTTAEAQTYAQGALTNWGMNYTVTAIEDGTDATVTITVPMSQAAIIDFLGIFNGTLSASATLPVES